MKNHSPNCLCGECTSYDPYIAHIRSQFGKNADFTNTINGGRQVGFNNFDDHYLGADDTPYYNAEQPLTEETAQTKSNLKQILGEALGGIVGNLIQDKKEGKQLPPLLDAVAGLGIKTEQAAIDAAQNRAESQIGKNVLTFSPYIIGGIILVFVVIVFLIFKK